MKIELPIDHLIDDTRKEIEELIKEYVANNHNLLNSFGWGWSIQVQFNKEDEDEG
jgi:hypothetical protein